MISNLTRDVHPLLIEAVLHCRGVWGTLEGRRAIDLACGPGYEAIYLASQGFATEARDNRPDALAHTRALAVGHALSVTVVEHDLEARPSLDTETYDLISVFNFLHRPLIAAIRAALRPGGVVVYETFVEPQRALYGKPTRDEHILQAGELAGYFHDYGVVSSREALVAPRRFVASLIARKPL